MIYNVTEEMIKKGKQTDCKSCPVALAVIAACGHSYVNADYNEIVIGDFTYETPVRLMNWMHEFDCGLTVAPISFELGKLIV